MNARPLARLCGIAAVLLVLLAPAAAHAELVIGPGSSGLETLDAAGQPDNRAGSHPFRALQHFDLETVGAEEEAMEVVFELPAGLSGNVDAVPFCTKAEAREMLFGSCPAASQIGTLSGQPIFNVTPGTDQVAEFVLPNILPIGLAGELRESDVGLSLRLGPLPNVFGALTEGTIELWGVPADHQEGTSIPRRALLTLPTQCQTPPLTTIKVRTWQHPERWIAQTTSAPVPTGCGQLPFAPGVGLALDTAKADAPSGADIELKVPQDEDPEGRATSQIEDVDVLLPEGMTLSPGAAAGLVACSDEQLGKGSGADPACPAASRVGTVTMHAPALGADAIAGSVYLGQERPGDRLRFFVAANVRGSAVKFTGSMRTDPKTGRLTASLSNLPQVAFNAMTLHFDGGPDALLATPLTCGPAKSSATFTPYSASAPVQSTATVTIAGPGGGACSGQPSFSPSFSGGSTSSAAGKATGFRSLLTRHDGEQLPARMEIAFPAGMSATLGTVASCPEADAARGTCPPSSQIGHALAELGPGPAPAQVKGQMFLTGPYRGQPYGLAMAFAGKLGPLDLGTLVVRGSMRVDAKSGQLSAVIDSLPRLFEGIAVRFQAIGLQIDRPGFLSNPTSCAPSNIVSTTGSTTGQLSRTEVPFKVNGCVDLPFKPSFGLALNGRSQLKKGGKPGLSVSVGLPANGANMRSADISLPGPLALDSSAPAEICARRKAIEGRCSARSQVGTASAKTPMLNGPLKGGVFIAQPKGGGQPDIWTHLQGGGISLDMQSNTLAKDGGLHTRFTDLPDLPVSKLQIDFDSGKHGLFELKSGLCRKGKAKRLHGEVLSAGQNGAQVRTSVGVVARAQC